MSGEITGAVLACGPIFKGAIRQTLIALGDHSNVDGECFPSIRMLAWTSGVCERHVKRSIKELERLGLVKVVRRRGKTVNNYVVNIVMLQEIAWHLRSLKKREHREGRDWVGACNDAALRLRDRLYDDPDSFRVCEPCDDTASPQECIKAGDTMSPKRGRGDTSGKCEDRIVPFKGTSGVPFEGPPDSPQTYNNHKEPSALRISETREALKTVSALAEEIGKSDRVILTKVGTLEKAEALALEYFSGRIDRDEVCVQLGMSTSRDVAPLDDRNRRECNATKTAA